MLIQLLISGSTEPRIWRTVIVVALIAPLACLITAPCASPPEAVSAMSRNTPITSDAVLTTNVVRRL